MPAVVERGARGARKPGKGNAAAERKHSGRDAENGAASGRERRREKDGTTSDAVSGEQQRQQDRLGSRQPARPAL